MHKESQDTRWIQHCVALERFPFPAGSLLSG